nr:MAG TPA: hypothetical protein [Caudoviricetes sp.]
MSISNEVDRLKSAKTALRAAIEAKGVSVPESSTIDSYAEYVAAIPNGVTSVNGQTGDVEIKVSTVSVTLLASGWDTSGDWPKYTLALAGITADSNQEYLPPVNPSTEVVEALQAALFQDGGQAAGVAYILAYGEVPTIDLPIRVILRGVL